MPRYLNIGGDSGVYSYSISETSITVIFKRTSRSYTYSYYKAGSGHVENMKKLAIAGSGLNSYIKRNVNNLYD